MMKISRTICIIFLALVMTASAVTQLSCGSSKAALPPIQAEARNIGLFMEIDGDSRLQKPVIILMKKTIENLYYTETIIVPTIRARSIEELDAQIFFRLSELMVDDLIIIRGKVRSLGPGLTGFVGNIQLWNIAMGKEIFNKSVKVKGVNDSEGFPSALRYYTHRIFAYNFAEPGLFPRVSLEKSGDLFFKRKEFPLAQEMYHKAFEKTDTNSRFAMRDKLRLKEKLSLTEKEIRRRGIKMEESTSIYEEKFNYYSISTQVANRFTRAYKDTGLRTELKQVTNKPVKFFIQYSDVGKRAEYPTYVGYSMHVVIRFEQMLYSKRVEKEPRLKDGYLVLSLNPFAKVMFQMLAWRDSFMSTLSEDEAETYGNMKMYIHLNTAVGDEVAFKVTRSASGMPDAPSELVISIQEYDNHKITTASFSETHASGYFLINPDSVPTALKLMMDFFGLE